MANLDDAQAVWGRPHWGGEHEESEDYEHGEAGGHVHPDRQHGAHKIVLAEDLSFQRCVLKLAPLESLLIWEQTFCNINVYI